MYKVQIVLDRSDPTLMRPAMRFRGEIETGRLPDRLLIPREAVFLRASGPVVFARRGLRWAEVPVRLGTSSRKQVEVLGGLSAGDRILPVDPSSPGGPSGVPSVGGGAGG